MRARRPLRSGLRLLRKRRLFRIAAAIASDSLGGPVYLCESICIHVCISSFIVCVCVFLFVRSVCKYIYTYCPSERKSSHQGGWREDLD